MTESSSIYKRGKQESGFFWALRYFSNNVMLQCFCSNNNSAQKNSKYWTANEIMIPIALHEKIVNCYIASYVLGIFWCTSISFTAQTALGRPTMCPCTIYVLQTWSEIIITKQAAVNVVAPMSFVVALQEKKPELRIRLHSEFDLIVSHSHVPIETRQ